MIASIKTFLVSLRIELRETSDIFFQLKIKAWTIGWGHYKNIDAVIWLASIYKPRRPSGNGVMDKALACWAGGRGSIHTVP